MSELEIAFRVVTYRVYLIVYYLVKRTHLQLLLAYYTVKLEWETRYREYSLRRMRRNLNSFLCRYGQREGARVGFPQLASIPPSAADLDAAKKQLLELKTQYILAILNQADVGTLGIRRRTLQQAYTLYCIMAWAAGNTELEPAGFALEEVEQEAIAQF